MADLLQIVPSLDAIASDPEVVAELPPEATVALLARCARVQSALIERQLTGLLIDRNGAAASHTDADGDRLLTIEQAAQRTGLSRGALYRRKDLPFRVQVGPATVRFSSRGIDKWIISRRAKL